MFDDFSEGADLPTVSPTNLEKMGSIPVAEEKLSKQSVDSYTFFVPKPRASDDLTESLAVDTTFEEVVRTLDVPAICFKVAVSCGCMN